MRVLVALLLAACGGASPTPTKATATECPRIARHVMDIGPIDRWITELHEDSTLPIAGASDHEALEKIFVLACRETWQVAQRRCIDVQRTWADVERECSNDKVWWYQPT